MKIAFAEPGARTPIDEFIVKIASRCNINCDYCYEYNLGDQNWTREPKIMAVETQKALAIRIREHAKSNALSDVNVSIHGGEPLLAGANRIHEFASTIRDTLESSGISVKLSMQTNAILMSDPIIDVITTHKICVGVSLDGAEIHNNRHRLSKLGRSTFDQTVKGIRLLRARAPQAFGGVLAVIDIENDPIEVVDAIYGENARSIDLLLPHHTWDRPPPRSLQDSTEYADWYFKVWTAWISGKWPGLRIRFLENLVMRLAGHPGRYEQMSRAAPSLITISASGAIEAVDTLKSTGANSQITNLNIFDHSFDTVITQAFYRSRCDPVGTICASCKQCKYADICVGGYLPHRHSNAAGFDNPSVYCRDLYSIIDRISGELISTRDRK